MINKKKAVIIFVLSFLLSGFFTYTLTAKGSVNILNQSNYTPPDTSDSESGPEQKANEAKTEECPLNGQLYGKSSKSKWDKRRPLGIMVENSTEARPQSGLSSADIVYEAVAEGGITRFLAIYYCEDASYVGPVRLTRI